MKNLAIGILAVSLLASLLWNAGDDAPDKPMMGAAPSAHEPSRSGKWPKVRAEYLEKHPVCEACGSDQDLQVHHVLQFRTHPERELDPTNLITLCGPGGHNCHIRIGHSFRYFCE